MSTLVRFVLVFSAVALLSSAALYFISNREKTIVVEDLSKAHEILLTNSPDIMTSQFTVSVDGVTDGELKIWIKNIPSSMKEFKSNVDYGFACDTSGGSYSIYLMPSGVKSGKITIVYSYR